MVKSSPPPASTASAVAAPAREPFPREQRLEAHGAAHEPLQEGRVAWAFLETVTRPYGEGVHRQPGPRANTAHLLARQEFRGQEDVKKIDLAEISRFVVWCEMYAGAPTIASKASGATFLSRTHAHIYFSFLSQTSESSGREMQLLHNIVKNV